MNEDQNATREEREEAIKTVFYKGIDRTISLVHEAETLTGIISEELKLEAVLKDGRKLTVLLE